tara:strand:- start:2185 stop:2640 length:456 start_codon:yes stop_codon:yes gene_type:complete
VAAVAAPKVQFNGLSEQSEYDEWFYSMEGELERLSFLLIVRNALPPGQPPPMEAAHVPVLTPEELRKYLACSAAMKACLKGTTLRLAAARKCGCLVAVLHGLNLAWGQTTTVDQAQLLTDFNTSTYTHQQGDLKTWIAVQFGKLLKLPVLP